MHSWKSPEVLKRREKSRTAWKHKSWKSCESWKCPKVIKPREKLVGRCPHLLKAMYVGASFFDLTYKSLYSQNFGSISLRFSLSPRNDFEKNYTFLAGAPQNMLCTHTWIFKVFRKTRTGVKQVCLEPPCQNHKKSKAQISGRPLKHSQDGCQVSKSMWKWCPKRTKKCSNLEKKWRPCENQKSSKVANLPPAP